MNNPNALNAGSTVYTIFGWAFGMLVFAIGMANMVWVHPVPAIVYLLLSLLYFPPTNALLKEKTGFSIPLLVKVVLGIVIIMFTLGVSDLGDMIDGLARPQQQVQTTLPQSVLKAAGVYACTPA